MASQPRKRRKPALHPMQPVVIDKRGIARFKQNRIVNYLVGWCAGYNAHAGYAKIDGPAPDMNQIARMVAEGQFPRDDLAQINQLVGYSVSGCPNLPPSVWIQADADAEALLMEREAAKSARRQRRKTARKR